MSSLFPSFIDNDARFPNQKVLIIIEQKMSLKNLKFSLPVPDGHWSLSYVCRL